MTLTRTQLIAAGAVVVGLTQIGNGLKAVSYLVGVPEVAYAAKAKAEEVDDKFHQYLTEQRAYTEALNQVIQQQQQQQAPANLPYVPPSSGIPAIREYEDGTGFWCCDTEDRRRCYDESRWWRCE